ncbi:MAG: hypothetical protein WC842_00910 [Candidatus Paceibacterota bacterium]
MNFFSEGFISKRSKPLISSESINSLKSEHLKEGVSPIIACIETPNQAFNDHNIKDFLKNSTKLTDVDYFGDSIEQKVRGFKNMGDGSFVISPIDSSDKFSQKFLDCTGLVVAGQKKETKENISLLSHQNPAHFLNEEFWKTNFKNDLRQQLQELKKKSVDKTVDVVIVGGNHFLNGEYSNSKEYRDNYLDSIKQLSEVVVEVFNFEPVVITGPKTVRGRQTDDVYYDNEHRRLYIVRKDIGDTTTESFLPRDIEKQEKKWK